MHRLPVARFSSRRARPVWPGCLVILVILLILYILITHG